MTVYQPKTDQSCHCKRGVQRDNCPDCEGTGQRIDFAAIRQRNTLNLNTAKSLASREEFLRMVRDRITDDLSAVGSNDT